jgi:hypothetical protein
MYTRHIIPLVLGILMTAGCVGNQQPASAFDGTWIYKVKEKNFIVLSLVSENGRVLGTIKRPDHFGMDGEGVLTEISPEASERSIVDSTLSGGELRLSIKGSEGIDEYLMRILDSDHAEIRPNELPEWMRPWKLERTTTAGPDVATDWFEEPATPDIVRLQTELKQMAEEDQAVRNEQPMSTRRVQEVTRKHRPAIDRIYIAYGLPTDSRVGRSAANAFWLLVQHQDLELQKKLLPVLEQAAGKGEISSQNFAYLYDRVMIGEGKEQRWGTQISCLDGKPVLDPIVDPEGLEQRRRVLYLPPIDVYLSQFGDACRNAPQ